MFSLSRHLRPFTLILAGVFALASSPAGLHAQSQAVTLMPPIVIAGSPELIRVEAPATAQLDGEWLSRKLQFFRSPDGRAWFALAGVDLDAATGTTELPIVEKLSSAGGTRDLSRRVEVHAAHYRTESISVSPKFVEPDAEAQKEIDAERQVKAKVYAASAPEPVWSGSFRAPVPSQATDSFGTRRMFNGKLASTHTGMDFRAVSGTVVRASNSGVVVLARPLYYEGNCVIIDHGLGLFTLSMHFSRIDVKEGQHVARGDKLGLSGATGRVTGPHLHWAVRWQGAYLDPAKVLKLDLSAVR